MTTHARSCAGFRLALVVALVGCGDVGSRARFYTLDATAAAERRAGSGGERPGRSGDGPRRRGPAPVRGPGRAEPRRDRRVQPLGRAAGRRHRARRRRRPRDAARDARRGGRPAGELRARPIG